MQTRISIFASTAMAVAAASIKTIVNPSVAFANGPGISFKDRVAMEMDSGCARDTEVRDPAAVAMLTGKSADFTTMARDGSMIDNGPTTHAMIAGSAVLKSAAGESQDVTHAAMIDGDSGGAHGTFDQLRH